LRDSLLNLLQNRFSSGPLIIITQLCLGLAGLALQMDTWQHPFEDVVQVFSRDPALFPVLLEFLSVLPEEIRYNSRIPVPESKVEFFHRRMDELLTNKGPETLQLLLGFLQAKRKYFLLP
jgi:transportin-3